MTALRSAARPPATAARSGAQALPMIVGPTRSSARVLAAAGTQCPPFNDPSFIQALAGCVEIGGRLLGMAPDGQVVVLPGTGTMGMEALAGSLLPPGSSAVVVVTGSWGARWAQLCQRLGIRTRVLTTAPGTAPDYEAVSHAAAGADAVLATHVDSSTGLRVDLGRLSECLGAGAAPPAPLLLIDGICAAGAETAQVAGWGVDGYVTSSAKALGAPGGLGLVGLSARALALLQSSDRQVRACALDLAPWLPSMAAALEGRFDYVQSPPGNLVLALACALEEVEQEGFAARVRRHGLLRDALHQGLSELGLPLLCPSAEARANGVTVVRAPDGRAAEIIARARDAGVVLPQSTTPGLTESTVRVGHLGNVDAGDIARTVDALASATRGLR